jgi:hypothetical protein
MDRDNDPLSPGGREAMLIPNPVKQGQEKFLLRRGEVRQHLVVDAIRARRGVTRTTDGEKKCIHREWNIITLKVSGVKMKR